jgi:hypothetical protein
MPQAITRKPDVSVTPPPRSPKLPARLVAGGRPHGLSSGELVKLHHSLIDLIGTKQGIIVQFVAPEPDPTVRDVVFDLAYLSASWLGKRVLFVDGAGMRMPDKAYGGPERREPLLGVADDPGDDEQIITRIVGLDLYQMTFPSMRGALELAPSLRRMPEFLTKVRDNFDLVLIASPPASDAPMGMLLSPFVDGNVVILECGRTRAPVATELTDALRTAGGAVVGAVLTRYRSFVPRFLRQWL